MALQFQLFKDLSIMIFFGILASRLTSFLLRNKYIETAVQKGGVPGVPGCIEHTGVISKLIEDANRNRGNLAVTWLDIANTYGTIPHKLVDLTRTRESSPPPVGLFHPIQDLIHQQRLYNQLALRYRMHNFGHPICSCNEPLG